MKRLTARRTLLVAAVAAAAGPVAAQWADIRGTVAFEGAANVPEGRLEVYLEDRAGRRVAGTSLGSDGGSEAIPFSVSPPAESTSSPTLQVVVRLERADGWLVARGSAQVEAGQPLHVTLYAATY